MATVHRLRAATTGLVLGLWVAATAIVPPISDASAAPAPVPVGWTDSLQLAKHSIADFAEAQFGDRLTVVTRNDLNEIVVKVLGADDADNRALQEFARKLGPEVAADVVLQPASISAAAQAQAQAQAAEAIETADRPAGWLLVVDPVDEVVRVQGPEDLLAQIRSDMPPLGMKVSYEVTPPFLPQTCHGAANPGNNRCDRPIRGGVWMEGCTTGFIVRSNSDQKPYILTAGHCVAEPIRSDGNKTAWYADMSAHAIGPGHNTSFFYSTGHPAMGGDAGIVAIRYASAVDGQWGQLHAWVMVRTGTAQIGGDPDPVDDFDYNITGQVNTFHAATPGPNQMNGDRVCMTGTTTGKTSCGMVTGTGASYDAGCVCGPGDNGKSPVDHQAHHYVNGVVQATYCSQGGDSGGPVFSAHLAYGIESGGSGVCGVGRGDSVFYPVLFAAADLNVHLATGT